MADTAAPPRPAGALPEAGYDQDFVLWTERQTALIRAGRFDLVDWENVATEVEAMGSRERRELGSRLKVLVMHLLKWQFQPQSRSASWRATINDQRDEIEQLLADDPSLRRELDDTIRKRYRVARANAAGETGLALKSLPARCPYAVQQIFDETFFPGPIDETR